MSSRWEETFNRRNLARLKVEAHATLYIDKNIKKGLRIKNISPRGVGGLVDFRVENGAKVEILLLYPFFNEPVKQAATVAWCKEINESTWELGLDFGPDSELDLTSYFSQK